jgi:hypothetical protein
MPRIGRVMVGKSWLGAVAGSALGLWVTTARAIVLHDQTTLATGIGAASQDFTDPAGAFDSFDCQAFDDFVIPGPGWIIDTVIVDGLYTSGIGAAPVVRVQFFNDQGGGGGGGAPGTLVRSNDVAAFTDAAGDFTIPIPPLALPPGRYWLSVQAVMPFNPNGQWFWGTRTGQVENEGMWQNPNNGFGTGCTTPGPAAGCAGSGPDFLFQLRGALQPNRASATEKGSLLIFSDVELRWNAARMLIQDTFIQITNDNNLGTHVHLIFVNGDPPLAAIPPGQPGGPERAHPGWNTLEDRVFLTRDQPSYWSAFTGQPGSPNPPPATGSVSPFTGLDPGFPPGRPDTDSSTSTDRVLRGFVIAFAVNSAGEEVKWNHLAGSATVVNYRQATAWQYNAWSFQAVDPALPTGGQTGTPGILNLDGMEFNQGFDQLIMNFQAVGSAAFSSVNHQLVADTDLTLHLLTGDFRQNTTGPRITKAVFDVWNNNEVKFSGAERCLSCWDQRLLGNWAPLANHFVRPHLQTDVGKARINGEYSPVVCPTPPFPPPPLNGEHALLGVVVTQLTYDGGRKFADAGTNLFGAGLESATIWYDVTVPLSQDLAFDGK